MRKLLVCLILSLNISCFAKGGGDIPAPLLQTLIIVVLVTLRYFGIRKRRNGLFSTLPVVLP